jgi:hypothetical protein
MQGDQIGRIFACWAIVYLWASLFENYLSSPKFWQLFNSIIFHLEKRGLVHILDEFFKNSSGVDVMITIVGDFSPFLAKNWCFT